MPAVTLANVGACLLFAFLAGAAWGVGYRLAARLLP